MADNTKSSNFLSSLLGVLASILLFVVLVLLTLWISHDEPVPSTRNYPDAPTGASLKAQDAELLNSYGWVDEEKGIVRIPVEQAKDLVIKELNP